MSVPNRDISSIGDARAYEYLGAHMSGESCTFRVWAPHALSVSLVGDFCSWDTGIAMKRTEKDGVWQTTLNGSAVSVGDKYKYKIEHGGGWCYKSDPYAFECEPSSAAASVICDVDGYKWRDHSWMAYKQKKSARAPVAPLNVYGVQLDVWERTREGGRLAHSELATYVKQMGYTHVLLRNAQEIRCSDGCTGVCSFMSGSSGYGAFAGIASFVDAMHEAGVEVIFEISFDAFPLNEGCLLCFDGRALYEREDCHAPTADLSREEVRELVLSTLTFWPDKYHADGLCIKGLSSLLGCADGSEQYGQNCEFVGQALGLVKNTFADMLTMAECEDISCEAAIALGFDAVCVYGAERTDKTICGTGKGPCNKNTVSVIDYDRSDTLNPSRLRALIGYKTLLSSKRLTPMGAELGSPYRADEAARIEWESLESNAAAELQKYVAELNLLCLRKNQLNCGTTALVEYAENAFCLIHSDGALLSIVNLTPREQLLSCADRLTGSYVRIFSSDDTSYSALDAEESAKAVSVEHLTVPAFSFAIYERTEG